jgi:hypothetical protein
VLSGLALTYTDAEFTTTKDSLVAALVVTLICIGIGDHRVFSFEFPSHPLRFNSMNYTHLTPFTELATTSPDSDFCGLFSGVSLKVNAVHAFQVAQPLHRLRLRARVC